MLSQQEHMITQHILHETKAKNKDNLTRTNAYKRFYDRHPEMKWSLLASFVSRNAGWSMTDLKGELFHPGLTDQQGHLFFTAYERANWLIFSDAYPQLLLYEWSKRCRKPLFHLLPHFGVSRFMNAEWERFWQTRDTERLLHALIINEQYTIQSPIIQNPLLKKNVFHSIQYLFSEWAHFQTVVFPTVDGHLYGLTIRKFSQVKERITLGKKLAKLLFRADLFSDFYHFLHTVPHTGSRFDFEPFLGIARRSSPFLRTVYPVMTHSLDDQREDWFQKKLSPALFEAERLPKQIELTDWYFHKKRQLSFLFSLEHYFLHK
ncbi:DUF2515 domain-containing protein [Bacillus sp. (in: firmicutes)]|uniref:DUF2515 domain-containing protein n=1 Tax=Bacillus sp. TaxID=1409 RepID=UPI000EEFF9F8|nr:DUF2515 domain-containing protein [Bacillus sp. (in: firmicutes)]HCO80756.1 DUF2515 domain-containing protein [Bacillus sp. (in: firmicutes)]